MWNLIMYFVPVLLPTLVIETTRCDNMANEDVIVKYAGHAEADYPQEPKVEEIQSEVATETTETTEIMVSTSPTTIYQPPSTTKATTIKEYIEEETESVVFIPNEAPVVRLEDEDDRNGYKLQDLLVRKDINDVMDKQIRVETEAPNDVVFLSNKNQDVVEEKTEKNARKSNNNAKKRRKQPEAKIDCSNLDCNNSLSAICGRKMIQNKWQYRLFLNDCYFKKVNCNFKYDLSRYVEAPLNLCTKIGGHLKERPFSFTPKNSDSPKEVVSVNGRRNFSSRRSMAMNINGEFCSHPCPVSCPDNYDPQCAISATGQRKVFMNHCKLDDNSCLFAVVWHKRPLSECVGGKKADLRQNRFFIGWMQRVGIIDKKGKLVLE